MTAPVIVTPNWELAFEIMYDASNYAVDVVLGQHHEKLFPAIYYVSKVLKKSQVNYTTIEKE